MSFFQFDHYIASSDQEEYEIDLRRKSFIIKYSNILNEYPNDIKALLKLTNIMILFRNSFSKDSFLYFFLNKFDDSLKDILGLVIFEIFMRQCFL
jgi:hypothetical protein